MKSQEKLFFSIAPILWNKLSPEIRLRRQIRQRREFIYRKSIEDRERTIQDKKHSLKRALDDNHAIPTNLQKDAIGLEKTLAWKDEGGEGLTTHVDDEYRWAGVEDPKIMITTSRDPSSRLKMFAKEVRLVFPNSQRINRGNYELKQLVQACRANDVTDLIMLSEHRGNPDGMIICHLPYGPTAYFNLANTVMRHDINSGDGISKMSEAYPHLIFNHLSSKLGQRVTSILKYLFPVPKDDTRRVMTFSNNEDYISFRHHTYKKVNKKEVELTEVGPRFEMKLYQLILGTIDNTSTADIEWVYRPYMNTAKKRRFLSE